MRRPISSGLTVLLSALLLGCATHKTPVQTDDSSHDAFLSIASISQVEQVRADSIMCDDLVRESYLVSERYDRRVRLAGVPAKRVGPLEAQYRTVPTWAVALDLVVLVGQIGVAVIGRAPGAVANPITLFSDAARKPYSLETQRPLEAFKACMEGRGHAVSLTEEPPQAENSAPADNVEPAKDSVLGRIQIKCAEQWPDDPSKRSECEEEELTWLRRGIRR